jgi:hypothetical protein
LISLCRRLSLSDLSYLISLCRQRPLLYEKAR